MEALLGLPFYNGGPIFPPVPPAQAQTHRNWISAASSGYSDWLGDPEDVLMRDGSRAAYLDIFSSDGSLESINEHIAQRYTRRGYTAVGFYTPQEFAELLNDLQEWRNQPFIQEAERNEKLCQLEQLTPATIPLPFLDHPPLPIYSQQYAHMMNHWRAIQIYMSLILWPVPGSNPPLSGRYETSVEICRSFASLTSGISGETWCLTLAGIAFGGDAYYPRESNWMLEKQEAVLEGFRFPIVISVRQMMHFIWHILILSQ